MNWHSTQFEMLDWAIIVVGVATVAWFVYRAIQNGVQVNEQLVTEFSPEMALFRVDTVAKNHQGEPTIERVRVNKK